MPELPEVETVKESLKLKLIGKKIKKVSVYHENIIEYPSVEEFSRLISDQTIKNISRYGKWLIFILDDYYLLSHLRMEGKYFIKSNKEPRCKHEHVIFEFEDNSTLRYMDVRKFGKMHLIKKEEIHTTGPFLTMGLEPWDEKLTPDYLKEKYEHKRIPIKSTLLDQSIIVGIGNIYANEILFLSKISPLKPSNTLTEIELKNIIKFARQILTDAIKKGGTTIRSYTSVNGVHGLFQQELYVHSQEGKKCPICGTIITKIKVGGRGTYFCPNCQK